MDNKEFLYIGHYIDVNGKYVLKIGTTNDIERRTKEHTRNYRRNKANTLAQDSQFEMDWWLALSKYNTLRFEDSNRQRLIDEGFGTFVRNDRFVCGDHPTAIRIKIRKEYEIAL